MKRVYNEIINEELYSETMDNGLEVYYLRKKGFVNKYAILGVDFGSVDLEFLPIGENERIRVSDGIAHFLEHKMFEQPDETNAFDKFSAFGASANAFTGFNMTAYLFSATENFYESLEHLIDYVQTPYYTDKNVNKEKGIIAQEIKMYNDDPEWNVYMNCLKAMYSDHHVNIDIAGSVESIQEINPEELYKCYRTFYNPSNMKLFIVGDLDPDQITKSVKASNKKDLMVEKNIKRFMPKEPDKINKKEIEEEFKVSMPMFYIGYKDIVDKTKPEDVLRKEIVSDILYDIIFSESGDLYNQLYEQGLVMGNLNGGYLAQKDYSYALVSGSSKDPRRLKSVVDDYILDLRQKGIDKSEFEINKKKKIGGFLKSFDSISYVAHNLLSYSFRGINFLDYLEVLKSIELEEIDARLREFFKEDMSVISIVSPKKDN